MFCIVFFVRFVAYISPYIFSFPKYNQIFYIDAEMQDSKFLSGMFLMQLRPFYHTTSCPILAILIFSIIGHCIFITLPNCSFYSLCHFPGGNDLQTNYFVNLDVCKTIINLFLTFEYDSTI